MRGYLGKTNLLNTVQQQDVVSIVAGGIDITPYLTLRQDICDATSTTTKHATLRWVCRDPDLIKYIHDEYVQPLLSLLTVSDVCLGVVLHNTSTNHVLEPDANGRSDERCSMVDHIVGNIDKDDLTTKDGRDGGSDNDMVVSGADHAGDEEEQPCHETEVKASIAMLCCVGRRRRVGRSSMSVYTGTRRPCTRTFPVSCCSR